MGVLRLTLFGTAHTVGVLGLADRKIGIAMRLQDIRVGRFRTHPAGLFVVAVFGLIAVFALPMAAVPGDEPEPPPTPVLEVYEENENGLVYRFFVDGPISEPRLIDGVNSEYTEQARQEHIQGMVVLEAIILADGTVDDVAVPRFLPFWLTESAVDAVNGWLFEPSTLEGEPVAIRFVVTVRFDLEGSQEAESPS
jgi:TonB family protein